MNRILSIILLLHIGLLSAFPQADRQKLAEKIRTDSNYVFGEGYGDNPGEAAEGALQDLLSKIGTQVESSFSQLSQENHFNDEIEAKMALKSVLNTYSQATLNNTETIAYHDKGKPHYCMRYMKKRELAKMYAERQDRVEGYVRDALRAEEKGRVDNALRYFNYAYILLHSLQYPSQVKMKVEGEDRMLLNWIPQQMAEILENVTVGVAGTGTDDNHVDMTFSYKGKPAAGIDFTYYNGRLNSPINSAKDGIAQISFPPDYPVQKVSLKIETSYADAATVDKELEGMIRHFKPLAFSPANKTVGMEGKKLKADKAAVKEFNAVATAEKNNGLNSIEKKDTKEYELAIAEVLKSIKSKSYKPNPALFTEEGLDMFEKLMGYGSATILGTPEPAFYPFGERVIARSVPMKFSFKNNKRTFTEDVTFTFSADKKIESVAFGLGSAARNDIFAQGGDAWTDETRMVIATFLENYKTAFALKRLDYIKSIFAEDAYIIVGHKLQKLTKTTIGDFSGLTQTEEYSFVQKSKEEYMNQLEKCFNSNEFININFANNDVLKAAVGGEAYGIQIKQDYYSEHYGDQGYLYLFVDMNDPDSPTIKIRTWQPERNPSLTPNVAKSNPDFGIYGNHIFQ